MAHQALLGFTHQDMASRYVCALGHDSSGPASIFNTSAFMRSHPFFFLYS